jgi:hypothetical protein
MNNSWSKQFSGSNNTYYTMPPIMSDGRNYSSWQPESVLNDKIKQDAGINSNWKYRQYLQQNANNIMKFNMMETISNSGNNPYAVDNKTPSSNVPHLFTSTHDTSSPTFGFNNSDLKRDFMTKQQMSARMVSPSIQTNW